MKGHKENAWKKNFWNGIKATTKKLTESPEPMPTNHQDLAKSNDRDTVGLNAIFDEFFFSCDHQIRKTM